MPPKPTRELHWKTVALEDIALLTHEQMKALSEARKRDLAKLQEEGDNASGPSAIDRSSAAGPSRNTREHPQRSSPYTRRERDPKSLEVKRQTPKNPRPVPQTSKSINCPSPESSPEPEGGEPIEASEENIRDTIEMMRVMQRENERLEKDNQEVVLQTQKMRDLAKFLQQRLAAEKFRTERMVTYFKHWQRTGGDWTYESIFPRRDVILMTKTDEDTGTTETVEVDLEDADHIPELKSFLKDSVETPGNLTDDVLQSIPPDYVVDFGNGNRSKEAESGTETNNHDKGKGKAKEVAVQPPVQKSGDPNPRKRGRYNPEFDMPAIIKDMVRLSGLELSKRQHAEETRHFTNLAASGSGTSGMAIEEPSAKRAKYHHDEPSPKNPAYNDSGTGPLAPSHPVESHQASRPVVQMGPETSGPFRWNKYGRALIDLPNEREVSLEKYIEAIRRAVQFIQAGPPPGFVAEADPMAGKQPLGRAKYPKFTWDPQGLPVIDIPKSYHPEHVNRLLEAVKFLGPRKFEVGGHSVLDEEEEASQPLEHEESDRALSVQGLQCSWTASGLPVITFTAKDYDDPQYIDNILLASHFILRGPGPGDHWEGKDQLPDRFRGHLPKDSMVICTLNQDGQPHIQLPPATSPCYYDRIIISAAFINEHRKGKPARTQLSEARARSAAVQLAEDLADGDDGVLNASFNTPMGQVPPRLVPVRETINEEGSSVEENAVDQSAPVKVGKKASKNPKKKTSNSKKPDPPAPAAGSSRVFIA